MASSNCCLFPSRSLYVYVYYSMQLASGTLRQLLIQISSVGISDHSDDSPSLDCFSKSLGSSTSPRRPSVAAMSATSFSLSFGISRAIWNGHRLST